MKQKTWIIILAVLAAVLVAAAVWVWCGLLSGGQTPATEPEIQTQAPTQEPTQTPTQEPTQAPTQAPTQSAQAAPDFAVYTADGQEVKLSDFAGKPVVLNFWASWCGPCRGEMPAFDAVYSARGEQVQFLMVNLTDGTSETVESASGFIADAGYTFPVFYDTAFSGVIAYNVTAIPATYFIDAQGNLVDSHVGAMNQEVLENYLQRLLP